MDKQPPLRVTRRAALLGGLGSLAWLGGCASAATPAVQAARVQVVPQPLPAAPDEHVRQQWLDRITWGQSDAAQVRLARLGLSAWLAEELAARPAVLPVAVQAQIDAMRITHEPFPAMVLALEQQRKAVLAEGDTDAKQAARRAYQQALNGVAREAQQRFVLRALYSQNQLLEHMTWFWMNHFNVSMRKGYVRALVGDYENTAIRPHALGHFRDLLWATLRHPAMLLYLDNARNARGRINENYARELMELHTLGVGSGYTQGDVQEMARVLTGCGISLRPLDAPPPRMRPELRGDYVREGLFEFNPNRHDYGPKTLLGQRLSARGLNEVHEAIARLTRQSATARFIAHKLAVYFVADEPPKALVEQVARRFEQTDGDIASTLAALLAAPQFAASLGGKFRDPVHYALAAVRLAWGEQVIANPDAVVGWIARMGEPLYGHETPDGYPLVQSAWASAGQMTTRFEIAHLLGTRGKLLFRGADGTPAPGPAAPPLAASSAVLAWLPHLGSATRTALTQASQPADWNTYLLSSPEMMHR